MKAVLHLEHLRYFHNHGHILFEGLIPAKEGLELEERLRAFVKQMSKDQADIRWRENMFRSVPEVGAVVKKRRLGLFAAELAHRPKVSLVKDFWLLPGEEVPYGAEDCQLVVFLSGERSGQGIFFIEELSHPDVSVLQKGETALLLAFASSEPR